MFIAGLGAILFGLTIGWIAYRIMRLKVTPAALTDLYTLLAVISGALIMALLRDSVLFGLYSLGLVIGFFGYLGLGVGLHGMQELTPWQTERLAPPAPSADPAVTSAPADQDPQATTVQGEQARTTPPKRSSVKEPKSTESL